MRFAALALVLLIASPAVGAGHSIRAHVTRSGTYVRPSHATNPNRAKLDNYSTRGRVNPYTGKPGALRP